MKQFGLQQLNMHQLLSIQQTKMLILLSKPYKTIFI